MVSRNVTESIAHRIESFIKVFVKIIFCFLVLITLNSHLVAVNIGSFNFTDNQCRVDIPFHVFDNKVILSVLVNEVPLNFILDSGSTQAILFDKKIAKRIGIEYNVKVKFSGVGNSHRVLAYRTNGVSLKLPGIKGERMGMVVLTRDYLSMKDYDIHGVIGYQLFIRFAIQLDYVKQVLTLMEPTVFKLHNSFQVIPMTINNSKPHINFDITFGRDQSFSVNLVLDTGAPFALALFERSKFRMTSIVKTPEQLVARGLGGSIMGRKGWVQLKLSNQIIHQVQTLFITPKHFSMGGKGILERDGTLGGEFLKNFIVVFDYCNQKFYIKPNIESSLKFRL